MFSLPRLAPMPGVAAKSTTPLRRARPPHIPVDSAHFGYALAITSGYTDAEACEQLGLKQRTVERWRGQLRKDATAWFGFYPPYDLCARFCVDPTRTRDELRAATAD